MNNGKPTNMIFRGQERICSGDGKSDRIVVLHFEGSWNQDPPEFQGIRPRISECLDQVDHGEKNMRSRLSLMGLSSCQARQMYPTFLIQVDLIVDVTPDLVSSI